MRRYLGSGERVGLLAAKLALAIEQPLHNDPVA